MTTTAATRRPQPVAKPSHEWPVGAFFLRRIPGRDRPIDLNQGRVFRFDGTTVWALLYSFLDGSADGIHALPWDPDAFTFYKTDAQMRVAYSYIHGTDPDEDEHLAALFNGGVVSVHRWDEPL